MATTAKQYGIFYKSHGTWSKNHWGKILFKCRDINLAVQDAKYFLKSQIQVKELVNNKWKSVNL